jgi:transposase
VGPPIFGARGLQGLEIEANLLFPKYIRAYVKRIKTDAADAAALLEAAHPTRDCQKRP